MAEDETAKNSLNDPNGPKAKFIINGLRVGASHTISISNSPLIVDSHMHIQSTRSSPLPVLWRIIPHPSFVLESEKLHREEMADLENHLGMMTDSYAARSFMRNKGFFNMIKVASQPTDQVADQFMKDKQSVQKELSSKPEHSGMHLLFISMVMTMDMEYAHLYGYYGIKIYNSIYADGDQEKIKPAAYWYPLYLVNPLLADNQYKTYFKALPYHYTFTETDKMERSQFEKFYKEARTAKGYIYKPQSYNNKKSVNEEKSVQIKIIPEEAYPEEVDLYEDWDKQVFLTKLAVMKYPLELLPLYHYDPRRFQKGGSAGAFKAVSPEGLFAGYKMYTAQGYRPLDRRLPVLNEFYAYCNSNHISVVNHCSTGGAPTYDKEGYYYFEHPLDTQEDKNEKKGVSSEIYFNRHFVSPKAWLPVLQNYPNLRFCLAHFGGNTDLGRLWLQWIIDMMFKRGCYNEERFLNLYTDISSSFAESGFREHFSAMVRAYPHIADRILFGTDWYLTLANPPVSYGEYCRTARETLNKIDRSLWVKFTLINPYRFFNLGFWAETIARNIEKGRMEKEVHEALGDFYKDDIELMYKKVAYIKKLTHIYQIY